MDQKTKAEEGQDQTQASYDQAAEEAYKPAEVNGLNAFSANPQLTEGGGADTDYANAEERLAMEKLEDRASNDTGLDKTLSGQESENSAAADQADATMKAGKKSDTEFAAEAAAFTGVTRRHPDQDREINQGYTDVQPRSKVGWIGLVLAILSLFIWPAVLGPAAVVAGFYAYFRGSRALGVWSIVIGLVAFIAYIVVAPFYS